MAPTTDRKTPELNGGSTTATGSNGEKFNIVDFPFPHSLDIGSISGSIYTSPQTLVQQTAYSLSKSIFSYSPEGFNLDNAVQSWKKYSQRNAFGNIPRFEELESRVGAGSLLLGYVYNQPEKQPSSVLLSSGTLKLMQPVLAQYAVLPSAESPLVFNVAAVDYQDGELVTDYVSPARIAKNLGIGLVSSTSVEDSQHVSLLATVLSSVVPTLHVYNGRGVRESAKATNVLNVAELNEKYQSISSDLAEFSQSKLPLGEKVTALIGRVNNQLGTDYRPFEYTGHSEAETVIVSFGSESVAASQVVNSLSQKGEKVGAINVRVYAPFLENEFFATLPKSTKKIVVLGQTDGEEHSGLYSDVATGVFMRASKVEVVEQSYGLNQNWTTTDIYELLGAESQPVLDSKEFVFWDVDSSKTTHVASTLAHTLSFDTANAVSFITKYDSQSLGGVVQSQLRVSSAPVPAPYDIQYANVVAVNDVKVLEQYDVLAKSAPNAALILGSKPDFEKVSTAFKKAAAAKKVQLYAIDQEAIGENPETQGRTQAIVQQLAFWKVAYPELTIDQITTKIVLSNGNDTELVAATIVRLAEKVFETGLVKIETDWAIESKEEEEEQLQQFIDNSFLANDLEAFAEQAAVPQTESWTDIAKRATFGEVYGTQGELRPDLSVKNFISKVKVNQRVTPEDYNRHIFHLELDITGTGLKYDIGEALGVHAPNSTQKVDEFIQWYGLDPNELVTVPSLEGGFVETKTVFQTLRHNLDIFGKPPKKFYEALAPFAQDEEQKKKLENLASPAGAAELKKRAEEDFVTFADILEEFSSARPSFAELVEIVAPLKRREYTIASSQKVHPNAVHLLIVVVDWVDSKGRTRYGLSSKHLSELEIGEEVVVSVKPSVLKLPQDPRTPIIMSGLGTGLAPCKAFLEEKALQKAQGHEIGEIYLFLGSRHQRQEYLYGELFEAYKNAGILTYIGAAFSRDQPQKIYIQDRIREASDKLVDAFVRKQGSFYLCGPTWPVPDVSAALFDIVAKEAAERNEKVEFAKVIESLKEEERYILEVY